MSASSEPITPARFAAALPALAISNLHAKAAELYNSLSHLRSSNAQLAPFADPASPDYDSVCAESIRENDAVMERMRERIAMLKSEVEGRGALWVWDSLDQIDGDAAVKAGPTANGHADDNTINAGNGHVPPESDAHENNSNGNSNDDVRAPRAQSGRLTDEELARRIMERMGDNSDNGGGMHL